MKISSLPDIDYFAFGALCAIDSPSQGRISIFLSYTNGETGVKEMKSFLRKSPTETLEPSFPGAAAGEGLRALLSPEEGLKQPYRHAAKRWMAATLLLTKLETI